MTATTTVTARRKLDRAKSRTFALTDDISTEQPYDIETRDPIRIPVPFSSPLSVVLHLLSWSVYGIYYWKRFQSVHRSSSAWEWAIYLCEIAFVLQELQGIIEITASLFGPREYTEHPQYALKGTRAPKVHILVTYSSPFPSYRNGPNCTDAMKVSVEKILKR